jgi:hypothetical protein
LRGLLRGSILKPELSDRQLPVEEHGRAAGSAQSPPEPLPTMVFPAPDKPIIQSTVPDEASRPDSLAGGKLVASISGLMSSASGAPTLRSSGPPDRRRCCPPSGPVVSATVEGMSTFSAMLSEAASSPSWRAAWQRLPCGRAAYRLPLPKKWAVSSAVEHCFHTAGATGSIPVPPTI